MCKIKAREHSPSNKKSGCLGPITSLKSHINIPIPFVWVMMIAINKAHQLKVDEEEMERQSRLFPVLILP